jgi:hypothetical protein
MIERDAFDAASKCLLRGQKPLMENQSPKRFPIGHPLRGFVMAAFLRRE